MPAAAQGGCNSVCERQVAITLGIGHSSALNRAAWPLMRGMNAARVAEQGVAPRSTITAVPVPSGYTQAWQRIDLQPEPNFPIETAIFLRSAGDGRPLEYVEGGLGMANPGIPPYCQVSTTLDGTRSVQIDIVYGVGRWPEREAIKAAVMRLGQSWLQASGTQSYG